MPQENAEVNKRFQVLNDRHNLIYQFALRYNDYMNLYHDYGTEFNVTMTEAHTLTYIEENPNTTITDLANYWAKTKSALSQTVSKLVKKGLVARSKAPDNAKTVLLNVTEDGLRLSNAHKYYDTVKIGKNLEDLRRHCSEEEIDAFYKVVGVFSEYMRQEHEKEFITGKGE